MSAAGDAIGFVVDILGQNAERLGVPGAATLANDWKALGVELGLSDTLSDEDFYIAIAGVLLAGVAIGVFGPEIIAAGAATAAATELLADGVGFLFAEAGFTELGAFTSAELSTLSASMSKIAQATIGLFIAKGTDEFIKLLTSLSPELAKIVQEAITKAPSALNGVVPIFGPDIPQNLVTWGSGVSSDSNYIRFDSSFRPTDTSIVVSNLTDGTVRAVGSTPKGHSFTLHFNADGTVSEVVQSVTLTQDRNFLDGDSDIQIDGVLSLAPGITGVVTAKSLTNGGTISVGDPTTLTLGGTLTNNGLIEVAAGSALTVKGPVTDTLVAPENIFGQQLSRLTSGLISGQLSPGTVSAPAVLWEGYASYDGHGENWQLFNGRMEGGTGAISNPALVGLGARTAEGLGIIPGFPQGFNLLSSSESVSYSFSRPVSGGTPFFLWDPGVNDHGFAFFDSSRPSEQ